MFNVKTYMYIHMCTGVICSIIIIIISSITPEK